MTTKKERDRQEAIQTLKDNYNIKPGDTVYCILRHVSSSGMSRVIDLFVVRNNEPRHISWSAATAVGWKYDSNKNGIRVGGCGMDMGFHLVYTLSRVLFRDDPELERDAGYALRSCWI